MCSAWEPDDEPVVGVVEPESSRDATSLDDDAFETPVCDSALEDVCEAYDGTLVTGRLESVLESAPSLLLVAGETMLSTVARAVPDCPVLACGAIDGIGAVDHDELPVALEAALEGDATVHHHDLLEADIESAGDENGVPLESVDALFDVTLVTDEPARISEFGVASRDGSIAAFRADGVVVATSAGSHGYAGTVDAPQLSRRVDAVAVAPIGPFVRQTRRWVLPADDLVLTVERDTGAVALVVDGRSVGTIGVGGRVTVSAGGSIATLSVSTSE